MNTFLYFLKNLKSIPMVTTWELEELAEMKGHQELYTKQSPQQQNTHCLKCTGKGAGARWERIELLSLNEATNGATEK